MLLWWDHVVAVRRDELSGLDRPRLAEMAVQAIEGTLPMLDPPWPGYFPDEYSTLIRSGIEACRSSAPEWRLDLAVADAWFSRQESLPVVAVRPGAGPFMMALETLVEGLSEQIDGKRVMAILSSCYEAVLVSQLTGRVTIERERANPKCQRAVRFQEDLITRWSSPAR